MGLNSVGEMMNTVKYQCSNLFSVPVIASILFFTAPSSMAQDPVSLPFGTDDWIYKMGGAQSYLSYRQANRTTLDYSVGADWNLMRSCQFDPTASITNTFADVKNSLYAIGNNLTGTAETLGGMYVLFKLQESFPTAYDYLMNGLENSQGQFQVAMKSCRDFNQDLKHGRNPSTGWITYGAEAEWSDSAKDSRNPVRTLDDIDTKGGDRGVLWVEGERRGGKNMPPIRVVGDVVKHGYQQLTAPAKGGAVQSKPSMGVQAKTGDPGNPDVDNDTMVFKKVEEAQEWVLSVVGEREIRTCADCQKLTSKTGQGLRLKIVEENDKSHQQLLTAIQKNKPRADDIAVLSVPNMGFAVTDHMLRTLKSLDANEQGAFVSKLSGEIAMMRVMGKALTARDILNAGMQEPNVMSNQQAMTELNVSKSRLDEEINNLLFETELRKKIFSPTALVLSDMSRGRRSTGQDDSKSPLNDTPALRRGAIDDTAGDE